MDKKTILGIVVVAVLFLGFAYVNTKQQEKYQQEMAAWQAYQDSVAAASRPAVPAADSVAGGAAESAVAASGETTAPEAAAVPSCSLRGVCRESGPYIRVLLQVCGNLYSFP